MPFGETIVALATPHGQAALAIVRVSGPDSLRITNESLQGGPTLEPRKTGLRDYKALSGERIDEVISVYYPEGESFTGEACLELNCHGNPLVVQRLIDDLCQRGCRLAEPGEFTRTAFLNGRIDLAQAEAIADLIHARSERALDVARKQLSGSLSKRIEADIDQLLRVQAAVEAYIDFPEEDLPPEDQDGPLKHLAVLSRDFERIGDSAQYHSVLNDGLSTVIVGPPNVGKSSLLNLLLGTDRAIVSPQPGTTRDFISERIMAGPYALKITDTAGIHEVTDSIESIGIQKTLERLESSDLTIVVLDSTAPYPNLTQEFVALLEEQTILVLENKVDLARSQTLDDILPDHPHVRISALTGEGYETLREALVKVLESNEIVPDEQTMVVNARHASAFKKAKEAIDTCRSKLAKDEPIELAAADLRQAIDALSEIVGKIDNEAMLDRLFSTFCIGK